MPEFWEEAFNSKQEMWGLKPVNSASTACDLFKKYGLRRILLLGFGYGRNAKVFVENGFEVTGIEISATSIDIARKHFGNELKVHHGSVSEMPFDEEQYNGIYSYALLHLLSGKERNKLIRDCYNQLASNGYMVFVTLSKGR